MTDETIHFDDSEYLPPLISISECIQIWISLRKSIQSEYDEKEDKIYKAMTDRILEASAFQGGFIKTKPSKDDGTETSDD